MQSSLVIYISRKEVNMKSVKLSSNAEVEPAIRTSEVVLPKLIYVPLHKSSFCAFGSVHRVAGFSSESRVFKVLKEDSF